MLITTRVKLSISLAPIAAAGNNCVLSGYESEGGLGLGLGEGKWGMQFASNAFNKLKAESLSRRIQDSSNESTKVNRIESN